MVSDCKTQLMLCGSSALPRVIVGLSLSSPMDIFMLPHAMLCPSLPSLRHGQKSLHSCSLSVQPMRLQKSSPAHCGYPVFLKETFFFQLPLLTAKLESTCSDTTWEGSWTVEHSTCYKQEIKNFPWSHCTKLIVRILFLRLLKNFCPFILLQWPLV